ncbi:MAG: 50S ribosomal protein L6 [Gammaproteobacteria bacterium HGW-Gammaproteobacteria-6]|jgi:large subunit ribosomal protein L6|nr:MAG: 50S ribosomal protein L6 [Gammaproteobacteria bacterium HGW-Gammaproteobacteria-6]PKM15141.1 MAG: 50S ribosomal protein L6 [Gammaproteobacteria bacterium HGW-Gammaproteobacteria-2]
MSRVAKMPIALPKGVEISIAAGAITVKGPKGTLSQASIAGVNVNLENGELAISPVNNDSDALAGTMRALLANMVHGVSSGFERKLELVGVGYRATMQGKDLGLALGFSHPIVFKVPEGVSVETPTQTEVLVKGSDKQLVGQVAAKIRAFRKPEPYKGKGVRYAGEKINMKEAKKA